MSDFNGMNIVDTKDETDRKCPNCSGVMVFDPGTGGLYCPFCDYVEKIPATQNAPKKAKELDFGSAHNTENCDWGAKKKIVLCNGCGAESIYDELQTASVCPFCSSNQVMDTHSEDTIAPGGVVPFQITDKQASNNFQTWIKRKWFCPKLAKESAKPTSFNGIYLPYWTFDTNTFTNYTGQYGKNRTVRDREGKTKTVTDWYNVRGQYQEFIDDELVLASKNHNDSILKGLEPYETDKNKTYKPEYLAGFAAERYSIGLKEAWEIAKTSIHRYLSKNIEQKILKERHADKVRELYLNSNYNDVKFKYLLLPIWSSNFKYKEKIYHFMVNGQTGKVSGNAPISVPKVILTSFIGILIIAGIYLLYKYM